MLEWLKNAIRGARAIAEAERAQKAKHAQNVSASKPSVVDSNKGADGIGNKVIEIISEQMGVPQNEITRDTHFINDLNADSLDTIELVMEFEDEFELSIPDEEAEKIQTVGQAIDSIRKHAPEYKPTTDSTDESVSQQEMPPLQHTSSRNSAASNSTDREGLHDLAREAWQIYGDLSTEHVLNPSLHAAA